MKKLKFLQIQFDTELKPFEIPAFRSAIIEKVGREHLSFHNHLNDQEVLYGYPVIQYKMIHQQPSIVCLDYGVDDIHYLFSSGQQQDIIISDRKVDLQVAKIRLHQFNMQVWQHQFTYKIVNWIALNQANYHQYKMLLDEDAKKEFLTKVLTGNIISFAKGIKWDIDKILSVKVTEIEKEKTVTFKKTKLLGFSVVFKTNTFLPNYIGLGKGVSHGFGIVKQIKGGE